MTLDADGHLVRRHAYGPAGDVLFDQLFETWGQQQDLFVPLTDHENSIRVVLSRIPTDALEVRQSIDYSPFGRITALRDPLGGLYQDSQGNPDLSIVVTVQAHHGSLLDIQTGLQFKGQGPGGRWYSPDLGQFMSVDPIEDGANWYMFAGNAPINFSDPTGLSPSFLNPLSSLAGPNVGSSSILSGLGAGGTSYPTGGSSQAVNSILSNYSINAALPRGSSSSGANPLLDIATSGSWNDRFGLPQPAAPANSFAPNYLVPPSAGQALVDSYRMAGVDVVGARQVGGTPFSQQFLPPPRNFADQFLADTFDAILPVGPPSQEITFSNGVTAFVDGGGPYISQYFNQVQVLTPFLPGGPKAAPNSSGVHYDPNQVAGPNPNGLQQRVVSSPTAGEGGVYLKPEAGRTKVGSTGDFRGRYGPNGNIEVEIPQTRTGPPPGVDDSAYPWSARAQRRFDEEYVDRITPPNVRYRDPLNPRSPVDPNNWTDFRHIFGYGDLPPDFGN
jgi:RHS repeat-associated protein